LTLTLRPTLHPKIIPLVLPESADRHPLCSAAS